MVGLSLRVGKNGTSFGTAGVKSKYLSNFDNISHLFRYNIRTNSHFTQILGVSNGRSFKSTGTNVVKSTRRQYFGMVRFDHGVQYVFTFFYKEKRRHISPRHHKRRTCLSEPAKARGWHQASGRSPTPPPSQSLAPPSTPRAAPKQTSSSCAPGGTPCCSPPRRLALSSTCRNPGDKFLMAQAIWLGGHSDSMVCLREACPRVTTLAPRTLTSPSLCLAGFGADGVPLNRIWAFMTAHVRPAR